MRHPLREWLSDLLAWARRYRVEDEEVADILFATLGKGGDATTTPPDAGT